jgi:hypothetical protein
VTALRSSWIKLVPAGAFVIVVSAAWIPLRDQLPNTDLALLLVVIVGTVGWLAGTAAAITAAVVAAVGFDVLDTRPYGALTMSRGSDITTALILLGTGLLVGAGAAQLARYHRSENERSDALAVVMEASGLVATGEAQQLIAEALGAELGRALKLLSWEFHPGPPNGTRLSVARDGSLVGLVSQAAGDGPQSIDLPVWCQGEVAAHYQLTLGPKRPSREELRVALSLADQAGAAMASPHPDPPPWPQQPTRLHVLAPAHRSDNQLVDPAETPGRTPASQDRHPPGQAAMGRLAAAP